MLDRQFIITDDQSYNTNHFFIKTTIGALTIFSHPDIGITTLSKSKWELVLIGFILNPLKPKESNFEILKELSLSSSQDDLFKSLESLSGKYVLISSFEGNTLVLNDCFSERQLYYTFYDDKFYSSSSEKLLLDTLGWEFKSTPLTESLQSSSHFLNITEYWFLTESCWDNRLKKLLPNHYISLTKQKTKRIPFFVNPNVLKSEILDIAKNILVGSINALTHRFENIRIPITAGYDSRLILAASIANKDKIKYHTFWRDDTYVKRDVHVAQNLSEKFNLNHAVYKLNPLRSSFIDKYKEQFLVPRILPKTSIVQFFKDRKPYREINFSGNGGEIFRHFYKKENFADINTIFKEIDVEQNTLQKTGLEQWLTNSEEFSLKYNIEIQDLFYHEIRLGKWASQFYHELDFSGIEFFSPFNNKSLVYSILLNINKYESDSSNEDFVKELMETMLEGSTAIPFNPPTWKDRIKNNIPYNKLKRYYRALKN